jgi:hypothetical protein
MAGLFKLFNYLTNSAALCVGPRRAEAAAPEAESRVLRSVAMKSAPQKTNHLALPASQPFVKIAFAAISTREFHI